MIPSLYMASFGYALPQLSDSATPLSQSAAEGSFALDTRQRAIVIGDPVPIVFCKRVQRTTYKWSGTTATTIVYDVGGVFVSPGATEGRFTNDGTTNELYVKLHLVLSQGDMPQLQLRDVFQRACRVGTWKQTYNRRAGTWTPGNFITAVAGKEPWNCPIFCGTSGYYDDLTTLSYENFHADGDQTWDRQVHCFVREGIIVDRLIEGTAGSSNNVCDLAIYLIKQSSRFPDDLIDTATFTTAANFTETQQLYYNGEFKDSQNLEDWLQRISTYFLLRVSDKNGKKAFRPRLPYTESYAIDTSTVTAVFTFTEDHILPEGFEIEWIPFADRRPTIMQMLWRQQPEDDIGLVRTSLVNIVNNFADLPIEQHDMSSFCASELHAVKVGTYLAARRAFVSHTLRITVKPDAYNSTLTLGDVVRVRLQRETDPDVVSWHDYFYEVERINKTFSGAIELDLTHYPIDGNGRSAVALYVAAAQIKNYEYPTGRSDFTCDTPGRDDNTDPIDDEGGFDPGLPDPDTDWNPIDPDGDPGDPGWPTGSGTWPDEPDPGNPDAPTVPDPGWPVGTEDPDDPTNPTGNGDVSNSDNSGALGDDGLSGDGLGGDAGTGLGGGSAGVPVTPNPQDPFSSDPAPVITDDRQASTDPLMPGNELTASATCTGGITDWYKVNQSTGEATLIAESQAAYILQSSDVGFTIYVETRCPDPGAPSGYGEGTKSAETSVVGAGGAYVPGSATWRIRRFYGITESSWTFQTNSTGFSVWMNQWECEAGYGVVALSYFDPVPDFYYLPYVPGVGFTACREVYPGQFIVNVDKRINDEWVFQFAVYSYVPS